MPDRRLQVFATVAKLLSFTKAAEVLHMTQPAVTFQIRQMEEQLNTRLFDRTHNRITLTETGVTVKVYADRILKLYKEMDAEIRNQISDMQSLLIIGASTTIGEYFLPNIIGDFQKQFPDVVVRLIVTNTNGVIDLIEENEIDIGIVEGPITNKTLTTKPIWDDELVLACSIGHDLSQHKTINIAEILNYPYISREEGSGTREVINEHLKQFGYDMDQLNIIMEFGSPESIKNVVAAGLGITIISVATMEKELALGTLRAIPLDNPIHRPFTIVHQRQHFRMWSMGEFLKFALEYCQTKRISKQA
ncbi:MAG: selenium metabolism-associated LysR family transcriptional regulator [Gammaproteobacteria bacterium]|nr:selenium metabolism-associated LysR family transcriptional regulator [Gammaproteobacteria bacterium]MCY4219967.1 selenium metabolism-associated LysR family transcriptional regulator [Gammaproteobacteria bacterium]MCY4273948.1 selenium metabolism-associated LysR family transcriptional regulator [Gammaproteobacteria bacterium]